MTAEPTMPKTKESMHLALFHACLTARHMRDVLAGSIGDVGLEAIAIQAEYVRENIAGLIATGKDGQVSNGGTASNAIGQ